MDGARKRIRTVRHVAAPSVEAGGSHFQATCTRKGNSSGNTKGKTQDYEVNEEQRERETSAGQGHADDSFLKEHQDVTNERGKGRSQECGGSRPGTGHKGMTLVHTEFGKFISTTKNTNDIDHCGVVLLIATIPIAVHVVALQ